MWDGATSFRFSFSTVHFSHIRQVFSRAEIEKYHSQNELYKLLSKEKVIILYREIIFERHTFRYFKQRLKIFCNLKILITVSSVFNLLSVFSLQ